MKPGGGGGEVWEGSNQWLTAVIYIHKSYLSKMALAER